MKLRLPFFVLLLSIIVASCGKKTETPVVQKKIDRIILSPEYLLLLKNTDFYVGARYFKDYTDKDEVSLVVNNTRGVITSETNAAFEGTNLLFRVPGITQAGDYKVKLTVKNDQRSLEKELTLRIVANFDINTVWVSLDKTYSSAFSSYADRFKGSNNYTLRNLTNTDTQVQFGSYVTNLNNLNQYVDKFFITALQGVYTLTYSGSVLQQIKIINGVLNVDPNFVSAKFYEGLTTTYGAFTSQTNTANGKVTVYKSGNYLITVTETATLVSSVITKV